MKYISKQEIEQLTDEELDAYAYRLTAEQVEILAIMDEWVYSYNDTTAEYSRRKANDKKVVHITNDSTTLH